MIYFKADEDKPLLISVGSVIDYLSSIPLVCGFTCHYDENLMRMFLNCTSNIHLCCEYKDEYNRIYHFLENISDVHVFNNKLLTNQDAVFLYDIAERIYPGKQVVCYFKDYNFKKMCDVYNIIDFLHFNGIPSNRGFIRESGGENTMAKFNSSAYQDIKNWVKSVDEPIRRLEAHILTPKIKDIYVNKKKQTIVIKWETNETTKVTCDPNDKWDLEKGIMAAITKYVLGNNYNAYSILDKYIKSVKGDK